MDVEELANRFQYHSPTEERRRAHDGVRQYCLELALWLNEHLPDGLDKSLAITNLELVMFWSNAALARHRDT